MTTPGENWVTLDTGLCHLRGDVSGGAEREHLAAAQPGHRGHGRRVPRHDGRAVRVFPARGLSRSAGADGETNEGIVREHAQEEVTAPPRVVVSASWPPTIARTITCSSRRAAGA